MISIIIPTLNERKNIIPILNKLKKLKFVYEIIFIDDNSSDGTYEEIKKYTFKKKISAYQRKKKRDLNKYLIYVFTK